VRRGVSKNCWKPKLTDGFGCIICNQQKDCASVETSLATVHARAQEMGKRSEEGVLYKGWCAHGPFGFVWFAHRLLESQVGDHDTGIRAKTIRGIIIPVMKTEEYICDAS
jgi:hypothetical protein